MNNDVNDRLINYFNSNIKTYELQDLIGKTLQIKSFEDKHEAIRTIYAVDLEETIYVLEQCSML